MINNSENIEPFEISRNIYKINIYIKFRSKISINFVEKYG